ncbi:hypothetical protein CROQUDRAFT_726028 [Cronartium quercuum f. sp. fusiforme G11]|uniref:Origin recognition complex subunit 3 N-terminal domain-containing protein n=1 Tax=Cronartium quercuum f. sp. fusiforme G11 TaxID=708437 RepID=A0A9P6NBE1_9BASI|nr:hypothetical protein CROQUDRAFT_726028 [Cronartium quercuum f. sp. fusiforme G11]
MSIHPSVILPQGSKLISTNQTTFRIRPTNVHRSNSPTINNDHQIIKHELFSINWSNTLQKINVIISDLQRDLLNDLITFIRNINHQSPRSTLSKRILEPIPTALLIGGSKILNNAIVKRIKELKIQNEMNQRIPEFIAIQLSSRTCLNFNSTIKTIVTILELSLNEHNSLNQKKINRSQSLISRDDVNCIRLIYKAICQQLNFSPKLVIIIEDFEAFNSIVLEDLILVFIDLMKDIGIVMLFSLSTSSDALHSLLHRTILTRLQVTPFAVHLGDHGITLILQDLIFDPESSFNLEANVIRSLLSAHEHLNNSIDNLISKLHFIHLTHFYTNPLINLFNSSKTHNLIEENSYENLIDGEINFITYQLSLTNSYQKNIQKKSHEILIGKLQNEINYEEYKTNPKNLFKKLLNSYNQRNHSVKMKYKAFCLLKSLGSNWPEKNRTLHWLLFNLDKIQLLNYSQDLCKLLRHSNDDSIIKLIPTLLQDLQEDTTLINLLESLNDVLLNGNRGIGRAHLVNTHQPYIVDQLVESDKLFSKLIGELSESLESIFSQNFGPNNYHNLIFNESWTFNNHLLLNQVFHPNHIAQIKKDLKDSQNNQYKRMYELYQETNGKKINLVDWFNVFKKNQDQINNEAKFLNYLGNLGFLGFLNNEKRKIEHVSKNVW